MRAGGGFGEREPLTRNVPTSVAWLAAVAVAAALAWLAWTNWERILWPYWLAALIGFIVGATEMIARYRDAPFAPLRSAPGLIYFGINGGAAALAYYLLETVGPVIESTPLRILVAGISAMALFRSGVFTVRVGDDDVSVGPHLILQIILQALDRTYDRDRAAPRSAAITEIMSGVSFEEARTALPSICFNLMQNTADAEKEEVGREVEGLAASEMSDEAKALILGLALFNVVGERTLRAAIQALGNTVRGTKKIKDEIILQMARIPPQRITEALPTICNELSDRNMQLENPQALVERIAALNVGDESKAVLTVHKLVRHYGEGTVKIALGTFME